MKLYLLLVGLGGLLCLTDGGVLSSSVWAVLIAGSNGWENYRHQADVCHAYHVLISQGVHPDRIIVFMYDDIANNPANTNKGVIINRPGGPNVYEGVKIDYSGKNLTLDVFRKVLLGDKKGLKGKGTGRVLESGPNDHVFINFVDHGAAGMLGFPDELLYAKDFEELLKQMKNNEKFGEMIMYIEACESGSMFDNILGHYNNIIVTTASAPDESSWGWFCDDGTCLADLFSISWMERMDKLNFSESLFEKFDAVRTKTLRKSHVNLYGDYRLGHLQFGGYDIEADHPRSLLKNNIQSNNEASINEAVGVNSRDVPLHLATKELLNAKSINQILIKKKILDDMVEGRKFADSLISSIINMFVNGDYTLKTDLENNKYPLNKSMFDCYKNIVSNFEENCYKVPKHYYFLKHLYKFANACVKNLNEAEMIKAIMTTCKSQNRNFDSGRII